MPEIIDIMEAEVGSKCERVHFGALVNCEEDAICTVIYDSGKQKRLCKKHLRIELNKENEE